MRYFGVCCRTRLHSTSATVCSLRPRPFSPCESADQASITLNFSRGAANVVGQYYQLLRLGRDGYTSVMANLATIAARLAAGILETGACLWVVMRGRGEAAAPHAAVRPTV